MSNILKINFGKSKRLTSLLGLSLDGSRLEGVVLRRNNGSLRVQQSFSAVLSLDPLTAAPELVGQEIRNHLNAAGVRERNCIVGLPLKWVLTASTELPPLPEADAASLLQLEAERGFHADITTLQLAESRCALAGDKKHVTFAGISRSQVGVVLGVASLFPHYSFGASLASEAPNLWPHVIYLAAWAAGALLIGLGGARLRMGALLAAGVSIVTFGLFVADAGQAISGGSGAWGTGLVLGLIGWLVCAIGSGLAVRLWQGNGAGRPQAFAARHIVTVVAALAALGTAITFAPSWDGYTLSIPNLGSSYTTAGNAFSNPGWVITGDVLAMIAVVLAVVVAVLWRPIREGAWLLAGAIIVMFAQAISALIQVGEPTSPLQFGVTPARAARLGLTITNSLTPAFWLFCAFVLVLMVGCGWLLLSPRASALDTPGQRGHAPGGPAGTMAYSWPHPFSGGAQQTPQVGPQAPESAQPGTAQPETAQPRGTEDTQPHATESTQPGAPQNTGLGIFDSTPAGTETTDPDILDSVHGKVEPDAPEHYTQD